MYLVDYTISRGGEGLTRGRRRVGREPKRGMTMLLAGLRIRVEQVEDLRALPGKADFFVRGHELPAARNDGTARPRSTRRPGRPAG